MKKLLVVVDYQVDFVNGTLGFENADKLDSVIANKIKQYRQENNDVIFTFDTHCDDYMSTEEGKNLPVMHCIKATEGHKLFGEVAKLFDENKDIYFEKPTFPSLELGLYLKHKNYDEVEVCGLVSNICVLSNVVIVKAALPNAKIIVDRNATDSFDKKLNDYTFEILKGLHVNIIN